MTTTGRRKLFRRKMWACVGGHDAPLLYLTKWPCATAVALGFGDRCVPVLVTEIRAGRGGKRGRK